MGNVLDFPKKSFDIAFHVLKDRVVLVDECKNPIVFNWIRFGRNVEKVKADFVYEAEFGSFAVELISIRLHDFVREKNEMEVVCAISG